MRSRMLLAPAQASGNVGAYYYQVTAPTPSPPAGERSDAFLGPLWQSTAFSILIAR